METFLTVLSFPFWFFGIVFTLASVTGGVKVNGTRGGFGAHVVGGIFGLFMVFVAYKMCGG